MLVLEILISFFAVVFVKNLKEAKSCQIAGAAKKLSGLPPQLMRVVLNECGQNTSKVSRIVKRDRFTSQESTQGWLKETPVLFCSQMAKWQISNSSHGTRSQELHWLCIKK